MVVMLGVLVLLMDLARDPNTWRWFAPDDRAAGADKAEPQRPAVYDAQPALLGPTDLDPLERDAAREEFAAVTDKTPLVKVEMPAYWRLMSWERNQSTDDLLKRADKDVTFAQLWQQPDRWRGKLVEIPVHLQRTRAVDDLPDNELRMKTLYEAWGWNSQSQPYSYWMMVPQLPRGMPQGESITQDATFVGYFFKLLSHEDREGKLRSTPLLIGRLIWHPAPNSPLARPDEWTWTWYLATALVALFAVRWGLVLVGRSRGAVSPRSLPATRNEEAVEAWLEGDTQAPDDLIAPHEPGIYLDDDHPETN
jgi:hypothetical protein